MIQGALTALITPFRGPEVDWDRLTANVEFQIEQGIDGLVPMGTTGESPTLNHDEHGKVIEHVVKVAAGRVKVIAGTGSNATAEAIGLTKHAKAVGADGALMVNPYYNKPTQEGLYRHFSAVADNAGLPIVLYNIPGRTGITMTPQTVARLANNTQIVAIKEATGDLNIASEILSLCDITVVSGDDSLTLPIMAVGGKGVISVLSNLMPARIKALTAAALACNYDEARRIHLDLIELCKVMFIETNPIPIKTAMAMAGKDSGELRLPLCEMQPQNKATLEKVLRDRNLI